MVRRIKGIGSSGFHDINMYCETLEMYEFANAVSPLSLNASACYKEDIFSCFQSDVLTQPADFLVFQALESNYEPVAFYSLSTC